MERDFKGVWIPKEIWLDDRLTALEKVILAEIDSLDTDEYGGCIAGNDYLAEFCQCSANKVALAVSKLKEIGYIELVSFDGRIRKLKSRLSKNQNQTLKKSKAEIEKEKLNNKEDKIKEKKDNKRFVPPTLDEIELFCKERNNGVDAKKVFDYYNTANWKDGRGNQVKNWKQKIIAVWERSAEKPTNKVGQVAHSMQEYEEDMDMKAYLEERRRRGV